MHKLMSRIHNKKCPFCGSEDVLANSEDAYCNSCKKNINPSDLECSNNRAVFHPQKHHYLCTDCKLVLNCIKCYSTHIFKQGDIFTCKNCGQVQTINDIHDKEHRNKKYVQRFHKIMYSKQLRKHLEKNPEGRTILDWIDNVSAEHIWPNPHNEKIAVAALAYREFCRKHPL